jgi:hypothetical protein
MNAACKYVRLGAVRALIRAGSSWVQKTKRFSVRVLFGQHLTDRPRGKLRNPRSDEITASGTYQILTELSAQRQFIGRRCNPKRVIFVTQPTQKITLP